jgi:DNA-binding transcriptional LysR family regulator
MPARIPSRVPPRIPPDWQLRARLKARQMALLVAIDQRRSLRQAAADIAVSQPAATKLLRDLEDALAVPLFDRTPRGMAPTIYGEALIRYARGMLTDLAEARDELMALAAGAKGRLRVGSVTGAVPRLLVPAIEAVRRGRPGLALYLLVNSTDVQVAALRQGTLDVAIAPLPAHGEVADLDAQPLGDEPLCVVGRIAHPLRRKRRITLAELARATWVVHPVDSPLRQAIDAMLARNRLRLPGDAIETVSVVATLALLQASDAMSVLPLDLAQHYEQRGLIARLPVRLPPAGTGYALITRKNRRLSPAAQDFADAVLAIASRRAPQA